MERTSHAYAVTWLFVVAAALAWAGVCPAPAGEPSLDVRWAPDYTSLEMNYGGQRVTYPDALANGTGFPPPGAAPVIDEVRKWPVVQVTARWTVDKREIAPAVRDRVLALVLLRVCDAADYAETFPKSIAESHCLTRPPWDGPEAGRHGDDLLSWLRGRTVSYEVKARAGFAASDYRIRTTIRMGVSGDLRTVFYHDLPTLITDHLSRREFLFAAHDAGDVLRFEIRALCVCRPRRLFRGEALRRVSNDVRYFVERIRADLDRAMRNGELPPALRTASSSPTGPRVSPTAQRSPSTSSSKARN